MSQISVNLETLRIAESRRGIRKAWSPVKLLLLATYLLRLERVTSGYVFGETSLVMRRPSVSERDYRLSLFPSGMGKNTM